MHEAADVSEARPVAGPETPPDMELRLSIGQVAERTGLSVHTLRFYERQGMFASPVRRDARGRRIYSQWDLEWLGVCTRLRASGMPLTVIRQYAELVRQGAGNEEERLTLLREHRDHVTAQINALTECLELITFKVQLYEESLAQASIDPLLAPSPRSTSVGGR